MVGGAMIRRGISKVPSLDLHGEKAMPPALSRTSLFLDRAFHRGHLPKFEPLLWPGQPLWLSQVAVIHIVSVDVVSRNRIRRVIWPNECALAGCCARARSVEPDDAVRVGKETVIHAVRIDVISVNPLHIDVLCLGALAGTS